jgi:hypothetical protein
MKLQSKTKMVNKLEKRLQQLKDAYAEEKARK